VAASYRCQLVSKEEVTMTLACSRRMLLVAVGLSVAVAVFPATAAHAEQPPAGETQLAQSPVDLVPPGDHPQPIDPSIDDILYPPDQPEPPQPPDPPVGPDDLANPTENPDPEPEPPDDLANPTENPEPQPPDGGGEDQSVPTPERVDTGLGGEADRSNGSAVPLAAFPLALAVLLLALVACWRRASTGSAR
jgi:outer membrane biosynthesis protein TonB